MTKTGAFFKRVTLFLIGYALVSAGVAMLLNTDHSFMVAWLSAMWVLAPFAGPVLFFVVVWTLFAHGGAVVQSSTFGHSMLDDTGPHVSQRGEIMVNGRDPSGNSFGMDRDHLS